MKPKPRGVLSRLALTTLLASIPTACAVHPPGATPMQAAPTLDPSTQAQPAAALLQRYEAGLNRADVDAIVSLYATDAVFMAQHREPAVGQQAIRAAYTEIFATIQLDIAFEIHELEIVTPTLAYARTSSAGTSTIVADGQAIAEANQELFLLTRPDAASDWQIARYIFSTTQPRG